MKTISALLFLIGASICGASVNLELKTDAEYAQWHDTRILLFQGDLGPVHEAYVRRDLKLLWNIYSASALGGLEPPDNEAGNAVMQSKEVIARVNVMVRDYSGRLLSQIPGHAKYLGDEIDAIAADTNSSSRAVRDNYLNRLAKLGSVESLHEIGRFWDDTRGRLPRDVEDAAIARFRENPSDGGLNLPSSVNAAAQHAMWDARVFFPWIKGGKKGSMPFYLEEAYRKNIDWWKSEESAKYRQPIDLTHQSPEEPPPARFDIQTIYKTAQMEKERTVKTPPPPPRPALPQAPLAPVSNAPPQWPLYWVGGVAMFCLLWLHMKKRKRA